MRVLAGLVLGLLVGCGAVAAPRKGGAVEIARAPDRPGAAPAAPQRAAPAPRPAPGVHLELPPGTLRCAASSIVRCDLAVPVTVTNGDPVVLTVISIELRQGEKRTTWRPEPGTLASGQRLVQTLRGFSIGSQQLIVRYRAGTAGPTRTITRAVRVDHPELERRQAACRACRGDWGAHGVTGSVGCNCRTRDAGQACRDGKDCEGECLFDHAEEVRPPSRHCSHGACSVTLRAVRLVGRCATHRTTFGCHSYIPDGESRRGPRIGSVRAPYICVD